MKPIDVDVPAIAPFRVFYECRSCTPVSVREIAKLFRVSTRGVGVALSFPVCALYHGPFGPIRKVAACLLAQPDAVVPRSPRCCAGRGPGQHGSDSIRSGVVPGTGGRSIAHRLLGRTGSSFLVGVGNVLFYAARFLGSTSGRTAAALFAPSVGWKRSFAVVRFHAISTAPTCGTSPRCLPRGGGSLCSSLGV